MRKKITAVFSKLLAFIIILSVFTSLAGCNKGSTLETVSEVGYRLDHIDSFYKYSSSGKACEYLSSWEKAHLLGTPENTAFSINNNRTNLFDFKSMKLTSIDYDSNGVTETLLEMPEERKIISARFSDEKLLFISYLGDEGFSYNKYFFSIYDIDGNLETELDITEYFNGDIPEIGLAANNNYPLFTGSRIVIWNGSEGTISDNDMVKEIKKGFILKDVKCLDENQIAIIARSTNETDDSESKLIIANQNFKTQNRYEIKESVRTFAEGSDIILYGDDALLEIMGEECKLMLRWEESLLDTPFVVSKDNSRLKIIGGLSLEEIEQGAVYNLFLFSIEERLSKPDKTIKMAAFGGHAEFLVKLFNLTNEEYNIELKQFDIDSSSSYSDYAASYRKAWLETSKHEFDIYFFPNLPVIDIAGSDSFVPIRDVLDSGLNEENCYIKALCGYDEDEYYLRPFFTLAGSIYCKDGIPEDKLSKGSGQFGYYELLPSAVMNQELNVIKRAINSDPSHDGRYTYYSAISIDDYIDIRRMRSAEITGFPDAGIMSPMLKGCGAFAFSVDIEKDVAAVFAGFLLSDFIQSFSYASKSVIPAIRKTAELQFYTYPFFDLSDVILAVHNDNVKVDIKRPMSPEEDLPLIRDFLDAVSSAKGIYDEDPVISMIFFEEYQRYTNGVVSLDEFVDSYYARVSIYLKEKET